MGSDNLPATRQSRRRTFSRPWVWFQLSNKSGRSYLPRLNLLKTGKALQLQLESPYVGGRMKMIFIFLAALASGQSFAGENVVQAKRVLTQTSCREALTGQEIHKAYGSELRGFNDHDSAHVLEPWITFTDSEVAESTMAIENEDMPNKQVMFELLPDGTLGPGGYGHAKLPESVMAKLTKFANDLSEIFKITKGYPPRKVSFGVRVSSNTVGRFINQSREGDAETGLHNHAAYSNGRPLPGKRSGAIDFVWGVKGPGPRIQIGNQIVTAPENSISFFGIEVMHGSPDSTGLRFLIVGSVDE